jgi:electron transfer flavoprotein alpha subunit
MGDASGPARQQCSPLPGRPLRIAVLVKQVPVAESLSLGGDGRLLRSGATLEMNSYCRRAVAKGVELAAGSGGSCTVFTLGPPSAEDALREALAWGADHGVLVSDPAFVGSDTLATARALAAALGQRGPFDLVLAGRNSVDGDTGQVGPELAELLGLPFASGVRRLEFGGETLHLHLEHDDGTCEVQIDLPALLTAAERLCEPCKMAPSTRAAVPSSHLSHVHAAELGDGPWGAAGSPTVVGAVRSLLQPRLRRRLSGPIEDQVAAATQVLLARGALTPSRRLDVPGFMHHESGDSRQRIGRHHIGVVLESGRPRVAAELLGAARRLADGLGARVVALRPAEGEAFLPNAGIADPADCAGSFGADRLVVFLGARTPEDVAGGLVAWAKKSTPWAILCPSTDTGREIAGRTAARLGCGLIGDAVSLDLVGGELVAAKPAFAGALVADITCRSDTRIVTVRPGVLPLDAVGARRASKELARVVPTNRVKVVGSKRLDDIETLARAEVVIGVGTGVPPDEYHRLSRLAELIGAELAATRKVTDKGWAPRSRQVGVTGRSISPRLYMAVGLSGKFNHMVGVRAAETILAINCDPSAPVFDHADIGIVGDWRVAVQQLEQAIRQDESARLA